MARKGPDSSLKTVKIVGGAVIGTIATAWLGSNQIVDFVMRDPDAPPPPTKVEPATPVRPSVKAVIGFDGSRSDIKRELPGVVAQTREFLDKTSAFKDGDKVDVCVFSAATHCDSFTLPGQKNALLTRVGNVDTLPAPEGNTTDISSAVHDMVRRAGALNSLVLVWTDGKEEATTRTPLQAGHAPVNIVVPREAFRQIAEARIPELGGQNVSVDVAGTSDEFGRLLESYIGKLDAQAMAKAMRDADAANLQNEMEFAEKMQLHEAKLLEQEMARAGKKAEIDAIKRKVKWTFGGLTLAAFSALMGLLWHKNRPRTYGWIVDARGPYSSGVPIPPSVKAVPLSTIKRNLPNISLAPIKGGMLLNGNVLRNGAAIADGIYWFEKQPTKKELVAIKGGKAAATREAVAEDKLLDTLD